MFLPSFACVSRARLLARLRLAPPQLIDLSDARQLRRVLFLLHDQLPAVRRCAYGKHIVVRLERATGQRLDGSVAPASPLSLATDAPPTRREA
jgi:hypothetical protein